MPLPSFLKLRGTDPQQSRVQDNIAGQLQPISKALSVTPIMGAPPPVWIAPALLSLLSPTGAGLALPGYHRDALSYTHAKGVVSSAAGVAAGAPIFLLAQGYRPRETQRFVVRGTAGVFQFVTVAPTGLVSVGLLVAAGGTVDLAFTFLAER